MSYKEIWEMLQSQEIFLSSLFPLDLYQALKTAMAQDDIVVLPGHDHSPLSLQTLKENRNYPHVKSLLRDVEKNPSAFGLDIKAAKTFFDLTLYQLGSLVVKREDFRVFADENNRILSRVPNQNDAICLINACGIRGLFATSSPHNKTIIQSMFQTAFQAAEKGICIVPAVGMGVWGGDPEIYWTAFFNAIAESDIDLDAIYVNPGHKPSPKGTYKGCKGEEFERILQAYQNKYKDDPRVINKLAKIKNLYGTGQDVIQLARRLKLADPKTIVSVLNASDPDVTLGFHVGEYTNNVPHVATTEENYTAIGTNGLMFEGVTNVHDPKLSRIHAKDVSPLF